MSEFNPIFPTAYQMKVRDLGGQQIVIINWLAQEAMPFKVIAKYPILYRIGGWHNRECYEAVKAFDWTVRMYR